MEQRRGRWRRVLALSPGVCRTALLALGCNLALELTQLVTVDRYPWRFKTPAYPLMFLLGALVVWAVVGVVYAVVGRFAATAAVMAVVTGVVAVADHEKLRLLDEPVYPSDWRFLGDVGFLGAMVGLRLVLLVVGALLLVVGGLVVWVRRRELRKSEADRPDTPRWRTRLVTAVVCLSVLAYLGQFNRPGNVAHAAYDALGASWRPWSQDRNYLANGFVGGFLSNAPLGAMRPPPGYSRAQMERIAARYAAVAVRIDRNRSLRRLEHLNVVLVLSESFSDPTRLHGVHVAEDPLPRTRRLMRSTTSGPLLTLAIGGGTANMEFEAVTGMSMDLFPPQFRMPYQTVVPKYASFPSVVGWLRDTGHATMAIHPFSTEMYRRREVYQAFGVDRFVHDTTMHDQTRSGHDGYISDQAAFAELRRRLEAERRPMLVNLVTMQNHMPYDGRYDDPVPVTGPDGERLDDAGQYARGISITDRSLAGLMHWLRHFDEPTVVAFYGDHLPSAYPSDVAERNGAKRMHETPFFVWSNLPGTDRKQPLTSPTHLVDLALQRAGAAVPPYYALLQEVRERLPAMANGTIYDRSGRRVAPADLSPSDARLLHDYRMVQYDLSVGKRYSQRAMFRVPSTA